MAQPAAAAPDKKAAEAPKTPASVSQIKPGAAPPARPAYVRRRHVNLLLSLLLFVFLPTAATIYYMYEVAEDQYASKVSFSIRSEGFNNPLDALGSLGEISNGSSSDAGILNEYLRSQKLIEDIRENVDLPVLYSKPENDPIFAFDADQPIEKLLHYWARMTDIAFDSGAGLIDVTAYAFTAEDATAIAQAVLDRSSVLVENLSSTAREDTIREAKFELERARERLTEARLSLGNLRLEEQLIDPTVDLQSRMGVLSVLQNELAQALIESDLLALRVSSEDTRLVGLYNRIDVLENRISEERNKIGQATSGSEAGFATVVGNYESLQVDREFAERAYLAAAASYDVALAEARRKSLYLVAHVPPTSAESAEYPQRLLWCLGVLGAALLFWFIALLSVYAVLDRR